MDFDAVNSLSSDKGKGSSSPRDACLKCGEAHFQRDCNARKSTGEQSSGKGKQSKSWSKSQGKGKRKRIVQRNQRCDPRCQNAHTRGKTSKTGLSGLENSKSETSSDTQESAQTCPTDKPWIHDGWSLDEWNDGEGSEQTYDN